MKTYKVLRLNLVFLYAMLGFLTGIGFLAGHLTVVGPEGPGALGLKEIAWFAVLAWVWFC